MKVALIACSKRKREVPAKARDLYQGNLFKKSLRLAELEKFPRIFILSAKYGLLELEQCIAPYDTTLLTQDRDQRQEWARGVIEQLRKQGILEEELHYFAGRGYYQYLPEGVVRFSGSSMGEIDNHLQAQINKLNRKGFKLCLKK